MLKTFSIPFIIVRDIKKLLHFYRFPKSLCFGNLFTINTKIGTQKMQYGNETQIFSLIKNLTHSIYIFNHARYKILPSNKQGNYECISSENRSQKGEIRNA